MIIKSIIVEGEKTINGRIYPTGSMQIIKERLKDHIKNLSLFCVLADMDKIYDITTYAGIVRGFDIIDGQAYLDIIPITDVERGKFLQAMWDCNKCPDLMADFTIEVDKTSIDENGIVSLDTCEIYPFIKLVKFNKIQ